MPVLPLPVRYCVGQYYPDLHTGLHQGWCKTPSQPAGGKRLQYRPMCHLPYASPEVRDLAWSLCSPALLQRRDAGVHWPDDAWYASIGKLFHPQLSRLDVNPQDLHEFLAQRRDRRLGHYFEMLWRYWLEHNPAYRLLHANLPVRAAGNTLGEFDLLVHDRQTDKVLHWELAVKFYLGTGDTRQSANWWGPGKRDRLDIKTGHLLQHQSQLSRHSEAQALLATKGLQVDASWLIVKGRLFYPRDTVNSPPSGANPRHPRGFWLSGGDLHSLRQARWLVLEKHQWLAPIETTAAPTMNNAELIEWWNDNRPGYPVSLAALIDGREVERGFIVPDDWSRGGPQPL